jgi:hypothetical protein
VRVTFTVVAPFVALPVVDAQMRRTISIGSGRPGDVACAVISTHWFALDPACTPRERV